MKKQAIFLIGLAVLLSLILTDRLWAPLERRANDARFCLVQTLCLGRSQPSGQVVVVGIEEKAVTKEKPTLFLYPDIGRFLLKMHESGVKVIGIDLIPLHRQAEKLPTAVRALSTGQANGTLTKASAEIGDRLDRSLLEPLVKVSNQIPVVQAFHGTLLPYYYGLAAFMKQMHLADIELTDRRTMNDGVIRSQQMTINGRDGFASRIYRLTSGGKNAPGGTVLLNYALAKNIPFYGFADVMASRIGREQLAGKAVILTYVNGYEDLHPAPISRYVAPAWLSRDTRLPEDMLPGGLIHAVMAETLLTGTGLTTVSPSQHMLIITFLVAFCLVMTVKLRLPYAVSGTLALMALFFVLNLLLFAEGKVIHLFPHLLSPLLVLMTVYPYRYVAEERQKKKIYKTFGYYIDHEVIDSLIEKDPDTLLKGDSREVCILFLDIRDFTRLSARTAPEEIVRLLNFYFGIITNIIKKHGGFVNKFIGDGILAFFASGDQPVAQTVRAAMEIIQATETLNVNGDFIPYVGDWHIRAGIGIHYGRVILGNIGSEKRMDFTIIGHEVNIASRIEGMTKEYMKPILLSGAAQARVKDHFIFEDLGEFQVKGIDHPIRVYAVTDYIT
jgi:class 3 adenylate cyclase/CHASE2 domain-containing sensor protein